MYILIDPFTKIRHILSLRKTNSNINEVYSKIVFWSFLPIPNNLYKRFLIQPKFRCNANMVI